MINSYNKYFTFYKNFKNKNIPIKSDIKLHKKYPITRYWGSERRKIFNNTQFPGLPLWLSYFDWVIGWQHGYRKNKFPELIFCHPNLLSFISLYSFLNKKKFKNSTIVFGGEDTKLSRQKKFFLFLLSKTFKNIFYEAKDIEYYNIKIMPIGLTEFYLRSFENEFLKLINKNTSKSKLLMCSFGFYWPHLNELIKDRAEAIKFSKSKKYITNNTFDTLEYLNQLSMHKYFLVPLGNGIQSPKLIEAILLKTIPIMTESLASLELKKKGFPILIVNKWTDINEQMLISNYKIYSKKINEFLELINDNKKYFKFCHS